MAYTYPYPHFAITVDCIVLYNNGKEFEILLIQRKNQPFIDQWALPGGFVDINETLEEAAYRELEEETGVTGIKLHQLGVFDAVNRDPRERTISMAWYGLTEKRIIAKAEDDAKDAKWFRVSEMPLLAFDHGVIIEMYLKKYEP